MNLQDIKKLLDDAKNALDGNTIDLLGLALFLGKLVTSLIEASRKAGEGEITPDEQKRATEELQAVLDRIIEKTA